MKKEKQIYDKEFRERAAKLALSSKNRAAVARELGVSYDHLRMWVDQYKSRMEKLEKAQKTEILETALADANKRNAVLQEELDILKKAAAYFAKNQQ